MSRRARFISGGVSDLAVGISVASQLPGRHFGGPADALRHMVLSAELTRRFGANNARIILNAHELEDTKIDRSDTRHDRYINKIGIAIGDFLRTRRGTTHDAIELSLQAMEKSLSGHSWTDAGSGNAWKRNADGFYLPPLDGIDLDFKGTTLRVPPIGLTHNSTWRNHPLDAKGNELKPGQSNWPGTGFRHSFEFELENPALTYTGDFAPPQLAIDAVKIYGSVRGAIQRGGPRSAPNRFRSRGAEIKSDDSQTLIDTYFRYVTNAGLAWDGPSAVPRETADQTAIDTPQGNTRDAVAPKDESIASWAPAPYFWNAPLAPDGKTVGQSITQDPTELEKFLAVNAKALVETATRHGLNFTQARKQLDDEWLRLAGAAGEARPAQGDWLPREIKDEISTRAYRASIDGESFAGNPDAVDGYELVRDHNGEPAGWRGSQGTAGSAFDDPAKIDALNRRRRIRLDRSADDFWRSGAAAMANGED